MNVHDVPAMVAGLQESLISPIYIRYLDGLVESMNSTVLPEHRSRTVQNGWEMGHQLSKLFNITPLYHVTESMTAVARHLAENIEDGRYWEPSSFPSLEGMLVYEKPLMLTDVWNRPISVAAIQWFPSIDAQGRANVSTVLYADYRDTRDYYNAVLLEQHGPNWMSVLGRWHVFEVDAMPYGQPVGTWDRDLPTEIVQEYQRDNPKPVDLDHTVPMPPVPFGTPVTTNLGKINYTIFRLMKQKITDVDEYTDKRLARRNRGKKRPPPMVTIIRLRRRDDYGYHEEGTGNWLTYRSVTRSHFRTQHYGPGRSLVKEILIGAYVRGPEGAPFHQPKRVTTLNR